MGFPRNNQTSAPPPSQPAGAPPPPPPAGAGAPPPPPPPSSPERNLWVSLNGQTVQKTSAEARSLPPATPAMFQDESAGGWKTIQQLFVGQAPAQQPAHRPAYGAPGQPSQPAAASMTPRGLFAGVENAQVNRRGANLEQGDYIAKLLSAEFKNGRRGNYVIFELACLVSSYDPNDPTKAKCNQEGTVFTIFVKQNESFLGNMKEIVIALSGLDDAGRPRSEEDTVTQQECEELVGPQRPFSGAFVYLEARAIKTKAGGDFTRINWWPCPPKADGTPDVDKALALRGSGG